MYPARARIHSEREERRSRIRFPMCVELEYVLRTGAGVLIVGKGKTENISADGVLFESDRPLGLGVSIQLRIAWPARLDARVGLRLIAHGRIRRLQGNHVAVQFLRHEFRTCPLKRSQC